MTRSHLILDKIQTNYQKNPFPLSDLFYKISNSRLLLTAPCAGSIWATGELTSHHCVRVQGCAPFIWRLRWCDCEPGG